MTNLKTATGSYVIKERNLGNFAQGAFNTPIKWVLEYPDATIFGSYFQGRYFLFRLAQLKDTNNVFELIENYGLDTELVVARLTVQTHGPVYLYEQGCATEAL